MQPQRPRIDLDGVALSDEANPHMTTAIFRHRTTEGLVILLPESADISVPWSAVESATLDLHSGALRIRFSAEFAAAQPWLRGAQSLSGRWLDRYQM